VEGTVLPMLDIMLKRKSERIRGRSVTGPRVRGKSMKKKLTGVRTRFSSGGRGQKGV